MLYGILIQTSLAIVTDAAPIDQEWPTGSCVTGFLKQLETILYKSYN